MLVDTQLRWTVLIVLFPDFTWKWGAVALPVPLVRLNLSVAPHHSLLTWPWAPVSPPARAHRTDPRLGRAGEIFKKYLKSTGHEAPSAFLLAELLFSFSAVYWLPKFDERPSWADNNSMQSGWCPSVFLKIKHFHELILQETANYHFDPFRIEL